MKNTTYLVTILTLSYCSPDIYAAIDSVLSQDYARIQYVLIDDATDGFFAEDVSSYIVRHKRDNLEEFLVLKMPENLGTVRAANIGLSYSKGKYIFNLAGDDVFYDNSVIKDWVGEFNKTGFSVITAYRERYDIQMKHSLGVFPSPAEVNKIQHLSSAELFEALTPENFIFGCCTAYTHGCVNQYELYDESYKLVEDYPTFLRLLREGVKIGFFDRIVVRHRSGGSSSPERYNDWYVRDTDMIYNREIAPYTKNLARARKHHLNWKSRQRFDKELQRVRHNAFHVVCLRLRYHILHPFVTLRGFWKRRSQEKS